MKPKPEPTAPLAAPKIDPLVGRSVTHPASAPRPGRIRSVLDGYAWVEFATENEAGQAPTVSLGHYKLTELTFV